jgi:hypothetical protein
VYLLPAQSLCSMRAFGDAVSVEFPRIVCVDRVNEKARFGTLRHRSVSLRPDPLELAHHVRRRSQ